MVPTFSTTFAEDAYISLYNLRERAKEHQDPGSVRAINTTMMVLREQLDPDYVESFLKHKASPRTPFPQDRLIAALHCR